MQVAFVITDLTMLRYFVPFSQRMHEFFPEIKQDFYMPRINSKYNGFASDDNNKLAQEIVKTRCGYATVSDCTCEYDYVFQIETGSYLKCKERISLQHGFDYAYKIAEIKKQADVYVCSCKEAHEDALSLGIQAVLAPLPPCMWKADEIAPAPTSQKSAFIFYPDNGDTTLANSVVDELEALGFIVFVKQRKKHQAISSKGIHMFDSFWYPSEAITLPMMVDVVIGFGSTAYVDLVQMGVSYVNVDIHSGQHPWNVFKHPEAKNYVRITDSSTALATIRDIAQASTRIQKYSVDSEQLRNFMLQLLT